MESEFKIKMLANPREVVGFISKSFYLWMIPIFRIGYRKEMEMEDLYETYSKEKSEKLGNRLEKCYNKEMKKTINMVSSDDLKDNNDDDLKKGIPKLCIAILKALWVDFLFTGLLGFTNEIVIKLSLPILFGKLLSYFTPGSEMSSYDAFWYAGVLSFCYLCSGILFNHYISSTCLLGMKVRVAVCSLIYRKSLRLSRAALGQSGLGKTVNLLSNDVSRFDICAMFVQYIWLTPLTGILVIYFIQTEIGIAGILGCLMSFITIPLQSYVGKLSSKYRLAIALKTDERVRFMTEIISSVQTIKMYVWEKPFRKLISWARKLEVAEIKKVSYVRAAYMSVNVMTPRLGMFSLLLSMYLFGNEIKLDKVFMFAIYYGQVGVISAFFIRAMAEVSESIVALRRLQKYLNHEEFAVKPLTQENGNYEHSEKSSPDIALNGIVAKWTNSETNFSIEIDKLYIERGQLVGIIGAVGSGKSSLLQIILREMPILDGDLNIGRSLSYASQESWIFCATIRQNIVFGQPFDEKRYSKVIEVCALIRDFEQFPQGDLTIVGDRGASLSGGQKARINLARAVYRKADIYLLDDPLSAVDTNVGKHLYEKCIMGFLKSKTIVLVTHQLHYLKDADSITLLNNGRIELTGTYENIRKNHKLFVENIISNDEEKDATKNEENLKISESKESLSSDDKSISSELSAAGEESVTPKKESEATDDKEIITEQTPMMMKEASSESAVKGSRLLKYLQSGSSHLKLFLVFSMFLMVQILTSFGDYWAAYWTGQEELRRYYLSEMASTNITEKIDELQKSFDSTYSSSTCLAIFALIIISLLAASVWRSFEFFNSCMRSSQVLHDEMFKGLIYTSMYFFNTNPSGRILNRFSKDINDMDEALPKALFDAFQNLILVFGVFTLVFLTRPAIAIPVLIFFGILFVLREHYLKTSMHLKRLERIHRSPVFSHLSSTLHGLVTIRVFGVQNLLKVEFDEYQDVHTAAWSLYTIGVYAFGILLEIMVACLYTISLFSFIIFTNGVSGNDVGLAITQLLTISFYAQVTMKSTAEVSNQLVCVERIFQYKLLPPEDGVDPNEFADERIKPIQHENLTEPPKGWPEHGEVQFKNLYMRYSANVDEAYVLKGLNCVFKSKEKIGIVGRTGAGKSSLIQALFRLAHNEGLILIDDVETHKISLQNLRKKISIIPQDPVLFSGNLRKNLDPFEEYSDDDMWKALEKVELKEAISGPSGLDFKIQDGGSNLSVGQRQLVCLARAILRNNRILVLDEATANVDLHMDELIQKTIREIFENCTVLTIAHRLNTIMDSDKVLVMDRGEIVEFDDPHTLLQNSEGHLYKMVQETGKENAKILVSAATKHYNNKIRMIDE